MNMLWFVVFSTIEAVAIFVAMFRIFRFSPAPYMLKIVFGSVLISILSYALRIELNLTDYFPVIVIIFYALFAFSIAKVPPFWSVVMSITAYTAFFVMQTVLLLLLSSVGAISFESVQTYGTEAYILQTATAVPYMLICRWLYKRGYGFSFSFERFNWRNDQKLMMTVIALTFVALVVVFMIRNLIYAAAAGGGALVFLLYLSIRKEGAQR